MTIAAIMQPTYLPWVGYFALMDRVDRFVFLDNVQFARRSWQQRNRIRTSNGELMLTVPVQKKGRRDQLVSEAEIQTDGSPIAEHRLSLENAYRKAPYFDQYSEGLFKILGSGHQRLADLNVDLISWFASMFGITTPTCRASELGVAGENAELLTNICVATGADHYLSPPGSRVYLDDSDALERQNISLTYFNYTCAPYKQQHGEFVPYLSAVDLLFNAGSISLDIIRLGVNKEPPDD